MRLSPIKIHSVFQPLLRLLRVMAAVFLFVRIAPGTPLHDPVNSSAFVAESGEKIHEYVDAKTQYLEDRRILETMQAQYAAERNKEGAEQNPTVIWAKAVPPRAYVSPEAKAYLAKVAMEVKPENAKAPDAPGAPVARGYDPAYVATQFEVLRSARILEPVIA
jgi:hypothetical protein